MFKIIAGSYKFENDQLEMIGDTSSIAEVKGSGHYEITFPENFFSDIPAVVVSPQTDNIREGYVVSVSLNSVTTSGFVVYFQKLGSAPDFRDVGFSFVATQ